MHTKTVLVESTALLAAVAASAGAAAGAVLAASGDAVGAPGVSHALARLGRPTGGGMISGIAVAGAAAALVGLAVFQSIRQFR